MSFVPFEQFTADSGPRVYINPGHQKLHVHGESPLVADTKTEVLIDDENPRIIALIKSDNGGGIKTSLRKKDKPELGVSFHVPEEIVQFLDLEDSENFFSKIMKVNGKDALIIDLQKKMPINRRKKDIEEDELNGKS